MGRDRERGLAMKNWRIPGASVAVAALFAFGAAHAATAPDFSLPDALSYPFISGLVSASAADRIAWVRIEHGVRNIWVADGPSYLPRQVTQFTEDDGQELTQLTFSPDGAALVFVRGGDHDSNWPAKGNLQPDPTSSTQEQKITLWSADPAAAKPAAKIAEGDEPALSGKGVLAFVKDGAVWTARLDGSDAHRLFFDRGRDQSLVWSPDGMKLAFVSQRDDHSFIGVYQTDQTVLSWEAPSTHFDSEAVWSPDSASLAFTRRSGSGGAPEPMLTRTPHPWSIWTASIATGAGHLAWESPKTLRGSYPNVAGEANLKWAADGRLTFLSLADNWPHLYSVPAQGGPASLLTPGAFMVEHVALSRDGKDLIYSANTGAAADDDDRRHLFRVPVSGGAPVALTGGDSVEWTPVGLSGGFAFVGADARRPAAVEVASFNQPHPRILDRQPVDSRFPQARFVTPKKVTFTAPDGLLIHGQLFQSADGPAVKPGLIFVHGGPPRQMMLGWSYMRYYSNAYAVNQYLAAHGFVVMSVNYRLGIGYGYDFQHPEHGGPSGASEYQDVLAGGRFLQTLKGVDPSRIGIWGGSYGGLLTAQALARNSDLFKAGVDYHGVHDWSLILAEEAGPPPVRYEKGDREAATTVAWTSSPVADLAGWTSPVLLIHGDDDRNVKFNQTIDLARRLEAKGVAFEALIIPDDIHDFLRQASWTKADAAAADFLTRKLGAFPVK